MENEKIVTETEENCARILLGDGRSRLPNDEHTVETSLLHENRICKIDDLWQNWGKKLVAVDE